MKKQVRDRHDLEHQHRGRGGSVRPTPNRSAIPSHHELARKRSIRSLGWAFTVRTDPPRPRCFPAWDSRITQLRDSRQCPTATDHHIRDRLYFACRQQRSTADHLAGLITAGRRGSAGPCKDRLRQGRRRFALRESLSCSLKQRTACDTSLQGCIHGVSLQGPALARRPDVPVIKAITAS